MTTNLGAFHVEQHGSPGAPVIVGWPSLFCDVRTMRGLVDEFARDHHVLLIDGPGHGRSHGPSSRFPLAACARAAVEIMNQLGVRSATWVGAAWGGHVGALAVLGHPERFSSLVTLNATFGEWTGINRAQNATLYGMFRLFGCPRWLAQTVARMMLHPAHREHAGLRAQRLCSSLESRVEFHQVTNSAHLSLLESMQVPTIIRSFLERNAESAAAPLA